jgi:hypothetical protein
VVDEDTHKAEFGALTEGWRLAAKQAYEWNQKGWIPEEVTIKPKEQVNREKSGIYAASEGAISRPLEDIADLRKNVPAALTQAFLPFRLRVRSHSRQERGCQVEPGFHRNADADFNGLYRLRQGLPESKGGS